MTHISEEARLENGRLENVIAKINQAAFRFALPRWAVIGTSSRGQPIPPIPNFDHALFQSRDTFRKGAVHQLTKKRFDPFDLTCIF